MAVGEVLAGGGVALLTGAVGGYFGGIRRRNDASRESLLAAYSDFMAAWSDLVELGASSVVTIDHVESVDTEVLRPALSALSRAMRVCLVTCEDDAVGVIGTMYNVGLHELAPL